MRVALGSHAPGPTLRVSRRDLFERIERPALRALPAQHYEYAVVRPGKRLGAIIGGEDDDGIVCLTHVIQRLHECTDGVVKLRHSNFFKTVER